MWGSEREVLILRMNNSPTDIIIFLRDMETLPVAATVSGISFVNSIVFSTNSSNNEIYYQYCQIPNTISGVGKGKGKEVSGATGRGERTLTDWAIA